MSGPVTLDELRRRGLGTDVIGDPRTTVRGVRHDSREVEPGDLFVAVPGRTTDGARFVADAQAAGAAAVAAETTLDVELPQLRVPDARRVLGALAEVVYGEPTAALSVVGLTGTNGKTTTTWLLDEALTELGERPALLGTIESRGPGVREPAPYTTPEGDAIARFARGVVDAGATHLVMQVSSHALAQHRADAVRFEVAGFTNLTQDHLDFHGTMENYFEAKARLFTDLSPEVAVVNVDDSWGAELARRIGPGTRRLRVGSGTVEAELRVCSHTASREGIRATLELEGRRVELRTAMLGAHNLENLALATGCLVALGHPLPDAVEALGRCRGAPGRLERVDGLPGVTVLVDYAHTPDALERALATLRPVTPGRLLVVFGCGGDRDPGKRPRMGEAAGRGADLVVVTSDNPRTEDPFAILASIEPGVAAHLPKVDGLSGVDRGYAVQEDRRQAIRWAIGAAREGDTVLIAGKGHEDYQIRGTTRTRFDDREEARYAMVGTSGEG